MLTEKLQRLEARVAAEHNEQTRKNYEEKLSAALSADSEITIRVVALTMCIVSRSRIVKLVVIAHVYAKSETWSLFRVSSH